MTPFQYVRYNKAFTLVELVIVISIISVLAAVVVPRFYGRSNDAKIAAARKTIVGAYATAITLFEQDTGRYPSNEEGLNALVEDPQIPGWRGTYIESLVIPPDPWQREYKYAFPSELTPSETMYDIVSAGPDGIFNNLDDVTNHDQYLAKANQR
ncbi:MAG: type II secretion system major pseudopilin GspG [Planctomycetes bacterium]|nr:type II secretion system major pseudopilin GspG [Planctomycetota bacterium]